MRGVLSLELADKNKDNARRIIEEAVSKAPRNTDLLLLEAGVYEATGEQAKQEATLRKLVEIDPSNLGAFGQLATLFLRAGKLDEARAEYEGIAAKQPKSVMAPTMVALILEVQKKPAEAQKIYEKIVAATPTAAVAANNLAWLYAENGGNLDVAMQLAQSASQQLPKVPQVTDTLGWVYLKKDLASLDIPPLLSSIENDPKNASYRYHLGLAYAKIGDKAKAKDQFDQALQLQPGMKEAEDARKALNLRS
jgi:Tfp pilus assembly protein PilF